MNNITNINDFYITIDGKECEGVVKAQLPTLEYETTEYKAAGMSGTLNLPITGKLKQLEVEITQFCVDKYHFMMLNNRKTHDIILRSALEGIDTSTGDTIFSPMVVVMKVKPISWSCAEASINSPSEATVKASVFYYKVTMDDEDLIEIDVLNGKCVYAGEDLLEPVNSILRG